jgi:hypothetical protein
MTTFLFFIPSCLSSVPFVVDGLPGIKKKPSRHPGRFSCIVEKKTIGTVIIATFFNLSGLLLKGR